MRDVVQQVLECCAEGQPAPNESEWVAYLPSIALTNPPNWSTDPPAVALAQKNRHLRRWIGLVALVAVGATAGVFVATSSGTAPTVAVVGTFVLTDDAIASAGCLSAGVTEGITGGTSVKLTGSDGKSIARTKLPTGVASEGTCTFQFEFPKAKTGMSSYSVKIANQAASIMTQVELKDNNWHFAIHSGPPTIAVTGTIELTDADTAYADCVGQGGYSDISDGTTVVITDQSNRILGSGALDAGTSDGVECTYNFTLSGVRLDEQQYAVEVSHRGKVVNSVSEMQANGWTFALTLGS